MTETESVYCAVRTESFNIIRVILSLYHHHHISVMQLGHLLTRSGLTYPEVSSMVCHNSFCQLENIVSLPWVMYYVAVFNGLQMCPVN